MLQSASSYFLVSVTGQVEEAWFPDHDDLYCRIFWVAGQVSVMWPIRWQLWYKV